jgi:hypothetical protein
VVTGGWEDGSGGGGLAPGCNDSGGSGDSGDGRMREGPYIDGGPHFLGG